MSNTSFSLVIPCFNEAPNLAAVLQEIDAWRTDKGIDLELIAVNDGSRDNTGEVLESLQKTYPWMVVLHHEKNQGYGWAVRSGLDKATKDIIGFMDSDRQFDPQDLSKLIPYLKNADFVSGRRRHRADPLVRDLFGKTLGILMFVVFGLWVRDLNCGMKIMHRNIWKKIRPEHGVEKLFNTELFLRLKRNQLKWVLVDVPHYPRRAGSPTGASLKVIVRMFREIADLKKAMNREDAEAKSR